MTVPSALIVREAGMLTEAQPPITATEFAGSPTWKPTDVSIRDRDLESRRENRVAEERVAAASRGADAHARAARGLGPSRG